MVKKLALINADSLELEHINNFKIYNLLWVEHQMANAHWNGYILQNVQDASLQPGCYN